MSGNYHVPAAAIEHCHEVKKSRFICRIAYAPSRAEAMTLLQQAKCDYPDARHHCWAYLLGPGQQAISAAFSDDGEPNGTAGKPILNVLNHRGVGDIMVIVIRYFGGIKLGAGGLVRAYSAATQAAIEQISLREVIAKTEIKLNISFAHEAAIRRIIDAHHSELTETEYAESILLTIQASLSALKALSDYCAARADCHLIDN